MNAPAPCSDDPDLFRSTRMADHLDARNVCILCPVSHHCRDLANSDRNAAGTYAGRLYKRGLVVELETQAGLAPVWTVGAR